MARSLAERLHAHEQQKARKARRTGSQAQGRRTQGAYTASWIEVGGLDRQGGAARIGAEYALRRAALAA